MVFKISGNSFLALQWEQGVSVFIYVRDETFCFVLLIINLLLLLYLFYISQTIYCKKQLNECFLSYCIFIALTLNLHAVAFQWALLTSCCEVQCRACFLLYDNHDFQPWVYPFWGKLLYILLLWLWIFQTRGRNFKT